MDSERRAGRVGLFLALGSSAALLTAWGLGHRIGVIEALGGLAVAAVIWLVETHARPLRASLVTPLPRSQRRVVVIDSPTARRFTSRSDIV